MWSDALLSCFENIVKKSVLLKFKIILISYKFHFFDVMLTMYDFLVCQKSL